MEKTKITISSDSYYYGGDYIQGRYYSGIYNGEDYRSTGRFLKVDNNWIKIGNGDNIKFSK
jgi:hypothetical protein